MFLPRFWNTKNSHHSAKWRDYDKTYSECTLFRSKLSYDRNVGRLSYIPVVSFWEKELWTTLLPALGTTYCRKPRSEGQLPTKKEAVN